MNVEVNTIELVKSVLLIDDDPSCNFILSEFINLVDPNIQKKMAFSVDEGLDYLYECTSFPEVIYLDLNMPIKSGFDFLLEFQDKFAQNNLNTKVIVLTSSLRESDKDNTLEFKCVTAYKSKSEIDLFIRESLQKTV